MPASYEETQTLTVLDIDEESGEASTLGEFRAGKPLVLDFWHTRCVRCPEAITKLDMSAPKHAGVKFAACALSLGSEDEGTQDQVIELLQGQWENMSHLYMTVEEKEAAKAEFGFAAVPFCVVFAADGAVLYKGDPSKVDLATVFDAPAPVDQAAEAMAKAQIGGAATPAGKVAAVEKEESPTSVAQALPVLGFGNDDEDF